MMLRKRCCSKRLKRKRKLCIDRRDGAGGVCIANTEKPWDSSVIRTVQYKQEGAVCEERVRMLGNHP